MFTAISAERRPLGPEDVALYIKRISIENVRSITKLEWECGGDPAGWHVILGDNGSGKSTFIRSVGLCLVGPSEAQALRQDWDDWLQKG